MIGKNILYLDFLVIGYLSFFSVLNYRVCSIIRLHITKNSYIEIYFKIDKYDEVYC